jgi:zinc D-Ala-D-Ala carboxypeptidase
MAQLSTHFSLEELCSSDTAARLGINNAPPDFVVQNLQRVANWMESVRDLVLDSKPIDVHSGYRSPDLNKAVGGVVTSAHCFGLAIDFTCPEFGTPYQVAKAISESNLLPSMDQLIREYGWVHIGLADTGRTCAFGTVLGHDKPRAMLLTKTSAAAPYQKGILQ